MSGWMKQLQDWIKVDWVFKEISKWKKWMDYEWINEWMNKWMDEQILERWQNWMLYSWRKAHLFILDSIKQSKSGNKKCKNRSFLVILTPRCVAICAVTWSFPFIWPTCDSRTYHWFNSKGPKKFSRSCICPTIQLLLNLENDAFKLYPNMFSIFWLWKCNNLFLLLTGIKTLSP